MTRLWHVVLAALCVLGIVSPLMASAVDYPEGQPAIVVLSADWCAKCRDMNDIVSDTLTESGAANWRIITLDVDNPSTQDVSKRYGILLQGADIPQVYALWGGKTTLLLGAKEYQLGHEEEGQSLLQSRLKQLVSTP